MLVPRFSIRTLLAMLTVGAGLLFIVGMGVRGNDWAWVASIALASLIATALVHAAWFGVIWLFVERTSAKEKIQRSAGE
jgi:hypothetical protein